MEYFNNHTRYIRRCYAFSDISELPEERRPPRFQKVVSMKLTPTEGELKRKYAGAQPTGCSFCRANGHNKPTGHKREVCQKATSASEAKLAKERVWLAKYDN